VGKLQLPQTALFHAPIEKDVVYTPEWLARLIVDYFKPTGRVLDPCRGGGAFHKLMPDADWCEIEEGRDFFAVREDYDYIVGNPPYSCLLGWIRHSFKCAENVIYLMPLHRVFASASFLDEVFQWGGIKEILMIGTGADAGFPFGHALGVVHYQRNYSGPTAWTDKRDILGGFSPPEELEAA
jgi:hypothetical protein